jgi:hypothetical protein
MKKSLLKLKFVGVRVMFWATLFHYRQYMGRFKGIVCRKKHKAIINWLMSNLSFDFSKYDNKAIHLSSSNKKVWLFWWDGQSNLPPIIEVCVESSKRNCRTFQHEFVTKDNFKEFVSIPVLLLNKFEAGIITVQQFSDILRAALLKKHGGIWLDASLFVSAPLNIELTRSFYSIKHNKRTDFVSDGRWTAYCLGGDAEHPLYQFLSDAFVTYYNQFDVLVDYFLIDYFISIAFENIPSVKEDILNLPTQNSQIKSLQAKLSHEYSASEFASLCSDTKLHKLNWRTNTEGFDSNSFFAQLKNL